MQKGAFVTTKLEPELLTDLEKVLCDNLGLIWQQFVEVINQNGGYDFDLNEIVHHIHILQRYVMSNAAARAYPGLFRGLGQGALQQVGEPIAVPT
jgi:uncharacterized protein YihD (DUF1040 family)